MYNKTTCLFLSVLHPPGYCIRNCMKMFHSDMSVNHFRRLKGKRLDFLLFVQWFDRGLHNFGTCVRGWYMEQRGKY